MSNTMRKYVYYPLRAVTMALFILLIRQITNARFWAMTNDPSISSQIPTPAIILFAILCTILITNSVINLFSVYDKCVMWEYLDKNRQEISFPREIKEILSDSRLYVESGVLILITVLFVSLDLYGEFSYVLSYAGISKKGFFGYLVIALINSLIVFLTSILTRYEARRYWHHLKRTKSTSKLSSKPLLIFKAVLVIAVYPIASPYLPYLVFMLFTILGLVITIANIMTTFGLILAVFAFIVFIKLYSSISYKLKKKKITTAVTATAKNAGFEYRLHEGEELDREGCEITLIRGEERYEIRFIKPRRRSLPLYFTERDAYFLYKIGTKTHYRSIESHFDYVFDAEGAKILLLPEIPRHLFVKEGDMVRRMNAGDRIWGYMIYEPKSLIGNLERDCLARANNDRR